MNIVTCNCSPFLCDGDLVHCLQCNESSTSKTTHKLGKHHPRCPSSTHSSFYIPTRSTLSSRTRRHIAPMFTYNGVFVIHVLISWGVGQFQFLKLFHFSSKHPKCSTFLLCWVPEYRITSCILKNWFPFREIFVSLNRHLLALYRTYQIHPFTHIQRHWMVFYWRCLSIHWNAP